MQKKSAFVLIELLTVAIVIAVIATAVVVGTDRVRARARDASRRSTVDAYSAAMEQWRVTSSYKTYFVSVPADSCSASNPANATNNAQTAGYGYMSGIGTGCVGYAGGGAGRMSRRTISGSGAWLGYAGANSVVDALRASGVLAAVRQDPLDEGKAFDDTASRDFILTTCDSAGFAAASPEEALNFSIYTQLELPNTAVGTGTSDTTNASKQCGGDATTRGWTTVEKAPTQAVITTSLIYNFGHGSQRF